MSTEVESIAALVRPDVLPSCALKLIDHKLYFSVDAKRSCLNKGYRSSDTDCYSVQPSGSVVCRICVEQRKFELAFLTLLIAPCTSFGQWETCDYLEKRASLGLRPELRNHTVDC